jgi:NAD+ kinase
MPPQILIVANMSKPAVKAELVALRPWLEQRAKIVGVIDSVTQTSVSEQGDADRQGPRPETPLRADLGIVFGGDGTLLAAARMLAPLGMPLLGVNFGKLGFLADFNVEHLREHLDAVLAGKVLWTERMMLEICTRHGAQDDCRVAANDLAVVAGPPYRMIELHVCHGDDRIASYRGDGVVISTPTGSTGYNLSLGGPILEPTVEAMVITAIAPHSLSLRPLVVPASSAVQIMAQRVNAGTTMVIDGQISYPLVDGQVLAIRRAAHSARIITHPGRRFFKRLNEKLQWAQSPYHV